MRLLGDCETAREDSETTLKSLLATFLFIYHHCYCNSFAFFSLTVAVATLLPWSNSSTSPLALLPFLLACPPPSPR